LSYERKSKKIKSLLRKHDPIDLLESLVRYMNAPEDNDIDRIRRHPWLVMLLIKWSFMENGRSQLIVEHLTNIKLQKILQLTHDLASFVRMPGDGTHVHNFMRNMAYQQFIYQHDFSITHFASINMMFSALETNHRLRVKFKENTGVDCVLFHQCCLAIYALVTNKNTININSFSPLFNRIEKTDLELVLSSISIDLHKIKSRVTQDNKSKGNYAEYYEQTSFLNYPFIKHGENYTCVNVYVFIRCIENYIYNNLKSDSSGWFMDNFGKVFENHLIKGLTYSNENFITETALKQKLPKGANLVDYLITGSDYNIFIDAKAVELPYLGKVSDNPNVILGKVENSALKAIKQAYEVNNNLLACSNDSLPKFKDNNYLLVVTYKELYLSNGSVFYESVASDKIDVLKSNIAKEAIIPMENIYFITLESFELLCSILKQHNLNVAQIIEHAKQNDKEAQSKKFEFNQHLYSLNIKVQRPDYLDPSINELTSLFH
jgi:hypothetical protein